MKIQGLTTRVLKAAIFLHYLAILRFGSFLEFLVDYGNESRAMSDFFGGKLTSVRGGERTQRDAMTQRDGGTQRNGGAQRGA